MEAVIDWRGDVEFEVTSGSGHRLILDGPPESGGKNAGPRPMELVLMGVGACSAFDVVTILRKQREDVLGCKTILKADRADEVPKVFTTITMHFVVTGRNLTDAKVARAVELSADKYCSASIMLKRGGVDVQHSFEIVAADEESE